MPPLAVVLVPGSLGHIANIVKGYAIAVGVAFAIWFAWHWWQMRTREAEMDRTARAKAVHARHLKLALGHPELAEPMVGSMSNPAETTRYRSYVASLLAAADEILTLAPTPEWRETLARQLSPHRSYLASTEFRDGVLRDCTPEVRGLIDHVIAG